MKKGEYDFSYDNDMKFVHIADLHLDTPLISLKNNHELIKLRRGEHRQIFKDVIKFVKSEKIELLFISGDLFENKFVEKSTIEFIISSLELIPETKVFITPGNHDPYIKNSPYMSFEWPENVKIFGEKIDLKDTTASLYGNIASIVSNYGEEIDYIRPIENINQT